MTTLYDNSFGPRLTDGGAVFQLWAPDAEQVELLLHPDRRLVMDPAQDGFFSRRENSVSAGTRYSFSRDGGPALPDPASRFQPEGVHGPSELVDLAYPWSTPHWTGLLPEQLVIYELHVGTFTAPGTFEGLVHRLDYLRGIGVTAIELMPLSAFAGERNWGYDGVFHFAPFLGYGTPRQLQRLVDQCHARGIAVILDLVTNHFGPEGNAMWTLAPNFFKSERPTPWSAGHNWDSEAVLRYFDEAVLHWVLDYNMDGIRLDAFHAVPKSARRRHLTHMLDALAGALPAHRRVFMLLESVDNQTSLLLCGSERVQVGQLNFDFQRSAHALVTGERHREYADYLDAKMELGRCAERGFSFCNRFSRHQGRVLGETSTPESWDQVVNFLQNHDTSGNRYLGQRLDQLVPSCELLRAVTAFLLLHPAIPCLFMGQEWSASTPFHFFTDFPEELGQQVQQGRDKLFGEPAINGQQAPRCQDPEAFSRSKMRWEEPEQPPHAEFLSLVKQTLSMRKQVVSKMSRSVEDVSVAMDGDCLFVRIGPRQSGQSSFVLMANLADHVDVPLPAHSTLLFSTRPPRGKMLEGPATCLLGSWETARTRPPKGVLRRA